MLERSYPGGIEYTVTMTRFDTGRERWTVRGDTLAQAREKCWKWAKENGWIAPKWWQWWRWNDSRPEVSAE